MSSTITQWLVRGSLAAAATCATLGAATAPAAAAPTESKAVIYLLYNKGNAAHRAYAEDLFKRFNRLGFADRMKSKGVGWVEANYGSVGSVASFLHIAPDEVIYFGILMADKGEHITREMFRAHVPVKPDDDEKDMRQKADDTAHRFYYELADVMDHFSNPMKWKRQQYLVAPTTDKAGLIKVMLDAKDVTDNKSYFARPPFKRQHINVAMVAGSASFWKRLGADEYGTSELGGGRSGVWIKKGTRKLMFEMGPSLTDYKTYITTYGPSVSKTFVNPTKPAYAYPEIQGNGVYCVPLKLVLQELNLGYEFELDGFTVNLSKGSGSKAPTKKPALRPEQPDSKPTTSAPPKTETP